MEQPKEQADGPSQEALIEAWGILYESYLARQKAQEGEAESAPVVEAEHEAAA